MEIQHASHHLLAIYAAGFVLAKHRLRCLEEHLFLCEICRGYVTHVDQAAMAAQTPLGITHATDDGAIQLWIESSPSGLWQARFSGEQLDGGRQFESFAMARAFALQSFTEMFPDHVCTGGCSSSHYQVDA